MNLGKVLKQPVKKNEDGYVLADVLENIDLAICRYLDHHISEEMKKTKDFDTAVKNSKQSLELLFDVRVHKAIAVLRRIVNEK